MMMMIDAPATKKIVRQKDETAAQKRVRNLLGKSLKCTLDDGRTVTGFLVCVDRLKNLILSNVVEERSVDSSVYSDTKPSVVVVAKRNLTQAMIPGIHLVKVEISKELYEANVLLLPATTNQQQIDESNQIK